MPWTSGGAVDHRCETCQLTGMYDGRGRQCGTPKLYRDAAYPGQYLWLHNTCIAEYLEAHPTHSLCIA